MKTTRKKASVRGSVQRTLTTCLIVTTFGLVGGFCHAADPPKLAEDEVVIDNDVPLSSRDLFSRIVTAFGTSNMRGFDTLRIDDSHSRFGFLLAFASHHFSQAIVKAFPGSVEAPTIKDLINSFPWRETIRQHSPLATGANEVQYGVDDMPSRVDDFASSIGLFADDGFENLPLSCREICGTLPFRHEYRSFLGCSDQKVDRYSFFRF